MSSISVAGDVSGAISIAAPSAAGSGVLTLPTGTDTLVGKATTDTLTNKTLTSPTITGATITVAATAAPAFSAYAPNNTQSLTTGTFTKIQFSTEEFDTNSNYDNATNYRFTPTVSGYYQVNLTVGFIASATGVGLISIFKNGTRFRDGTQVGNASNGPICAASSLIYFNGATDYVEGYAFQSSGGNLTVSVNFGSAGYFQASMVRSA